MALPKFLGLPKISKLPKFWEGLQPPHPQYTNAMSALSEQNKSAHYKQNKFANRWNKKMSTRSPVKLALTSNVMKFP